MAATVTVLRPAPSPRTYSGDVFAVGTWIYSGSRYGDTCGVIVSIESTPADGQAYDLDLRTLERRPLPRTLAMVRWDGGVSEPRPVSHIDTCTLRAYDPNDGRTGSYGFLAAILPDDEARAAFVARCQEAPARRAEEERVKAEEAARMDREVGLYFADLEDAIGADNRDDSAYVTDTMEAKVIRRALKELVGVSARVTVRRYSMASGLNFGPPKGHDWTDDEAARIASVFPGLAWPSTVYDRQTGESREGWRVDDSCHPSKRDDRSDGMTDYYDPGGFRVAPAYLLAVSAILSDEVNKAAK
jgi:hypothetical protein